MLEDERRATAVAITLFATACLPYTVASTAETVAPHQIEQTSIAYVIPNGVDVARRQPPVAMPGLDYEARYGIDDRSDVGVRVPSYSGAIVTYKRRLSGEPDGQTAATAVMVGAGVVNWAQHAHAELTLLASARESWTGGVTPYGGLRVMQVAPIERHAVHDTPSAGGFLGLRLGDHLRGISPELGIYYDHSALGLRRSNIIFVPAISIYTRRGQPEIDDGSGSGGAPRRTQADREPARRTPLSLPRTRPATTPRRGPEPSMPFATRAPAAGVPAAGRSAPVPTGLGPSPSDPRPTTGA